MENEKPSKEDFRHKVDMFIKIFGVIIVSGAITFYGIHSENKRANTQLIVTEENNKSQLYAQAMNSRQSARVDLMKGLLDIIMKDYHSEEDMNKKLLKLNLLALNLQEQMHLKPLFEDLEEKLLNHDQERKKLRTIASRLKRGQINRLVADGAYEYKLTLHKDEITSITSNKNHDSVDLIQIEPRNNGIRLEAQFPKTAIQFTVTYYDFPFLDFFPRKDQRYAIVLHNINPNDSSVVVSLLIYPQDYFDIQDRIRVNRLIAPDIKKEDN
ncbi:MAG: hypothetical protein JRE64_08725 [Deltaproteobacteria bacterium]|nr:hypothetical protein [Deltaproteobacteria bacterium]